MYELKKTQLLPVSMEKAWDFFSSPHNLSVITPPEMEFKILTTNLPDPIAEGMEIDYRVRPLLRIPMRWKSRLCEIENGFSFTDIQLKGPYSFWYHKHTFTPVGDKVLMTDSIKYKLPLGILGRWMHTLFVRKKLESIFEYRYKKLEQLFTK
jgi:ligand-binding SRPBCC domain-containing protein